MNGSFVEGTPLSGGIGDAKSAKGAKSANITILASGFNDDGL